MTVVITMPAWASAALAALPTHFPTLEEQMRAVIDFSRRNIEEGTGGPFAAGIFERDSGRLITIGVNRVVPTHCSSAHAEVVALSLAQQQFQTFDLGGPGLPAMQIVVNWRPCAMCYGAVLWSGVRSLVIAGSDEALEAITGFDEGPVHPQWATELNKRGIDVTNNVLREEAVAVFNQFAASGALVYNGRSGGS
jgi:tRNA(Arg) A34 adenosine deaminase TadA